MRNLKFILLFIICFASIPSICQNVGINTTDPEFELDVRSTSASLGSDLNISDPTALNFLRLRSHTKTDLNPAIWWQSLKHLSFGLAEENGSNYNEFLRLDGRRISILNTGGSIFIGESAGAQDDLDGNFNIGIGLNSLLENTSGLSNTAVGTNTMRQNTIGLDNTALGRNTMRYNVDGNFNVALGHSALLENVSGDRNTIIGASAGTGVSGASFSGNVMLGYQSGFFETSSDRLYIDNSSTSSPLIYGEFDNNLLRTNGTHEITEALDVHSNTLFVNPVSNNVGIGTATPSKKLDIVGGLKVDGSTFNIDESSNRVGIGTSSPSEMLDIVGGLKVDGSTFNVDESSNRVGIGTSSPISELHVKDGTGFAYLSVESALNQDAIIQLTDNTSTTYNSFNQWTIRRDGSHDGRMLWRHDYGNIMSLYPDGSLIIGAGDPADGYRLSVDGKIMAEEIRVQNSSVWPDYVFDPAYSILSLEELEKSIESNKHLPGIPSAIEVEENGFELGEMQRILVEKVEELTLHIIELNKRIKELEKSKD